jgi:phosphopantothenoylcysteine decarboxylase / phosphopantothenate---cysteine ligase
MLKDKKIILGITGSIAAYKAAILVRLLVKEGAEVRVVMTPLAKEFIAPVTLSALSGNPVISDFYSAVDGSWNSHVDLGIWADLMLVAPATANTIGKLANGVADNLLITTYLSARCPVFIAPAMDMDMFNHPSTQRNLKTLISYGNQVIEPTSGELASGLMGKGRMEEPETIVKRLKDFLESETSKKKLQNKKILITAGPTYEAIDPVRFIGNHSSGKMGYAIARQALNEGASVTLISGPTSLNLAHPNLTLIKVISTEEMYEACTQHFLQADAAILSAAVADFTPVLPNHSKIKREKENYTIELKPTLDIASELGKVKKQGQVLIGFALETDNEMENAKIKRAKKNFNFIVLNSLKDEGAGFRTDTNKITIIDENNKINGYELKHKDEVAKDIVNKLIEAMNL